MDTEEVMVEVKRGDTVTTGSRTLYSTRWGPVFESESFPWTKETAYALKTVEVGLRDPDQYMAVWRSKTVRDMKASLAKWQSFRFNATAVDSTGEALYGDMGMIPNVSQLLIDKCGTSYVAKKAWENVALRGAGWLPERVCVGDGRGFFRAGHRGRERGAAPVPHRLCDAEQ